VGGGSGGEERAQIGVPRFIRGDAGSRWTGACTDKREGGSILLGERGGVVTCLSHGAGVLERGARRFCERNARRAGVVSVCQVFDGKPGARRGRMRAEKGGAAAAYE
jgi:hypothetical protein